MSETLLNAYSLPPKDGQPPEQLVVLLHGYGANGEDLLDLASHWRHLLPKAEFIAPNAPLPFEAAPVGYQWFSLQAYNPQAFDPHSLSRGVQEALLPLHAFLNYALERRGLKDQQMALVGFSQGAMMSLSAALSRPNSIAGVVGYSGAYIPEPRLVDCSPTAVLLIHGEADEVVSIEAQSLAAKELTTLGCAVRTHVCRKLGHSINTDGITLGGEFLASVFQQSPL